jgi:hypothetical protein
MPKRTNRLQHLIHHLVRQRYYGCGVTESAELYDSAAGEDREVDIVVETDSGGQKQLLCFECRSATDTGQRRRAGVSWVDEMLGKHRDLPTNELVLASETGFTAGASSKASSYRMETITLDDAPKAAWTRIAGKEPRLHHQEINHAFKCSFVVRNDAGVPEYRPAPLGQVVGDWVVQTTVGAVVDYFFGQQEVADAFFAKMRADEEEPFTLDFTPPKDRPTYFINASGHRTPWERLVVHIQSIRSSAVVPLRHGSAWGKPVAYGEAEGSAGRVMISVIEEEGRPGAFMVRLSTGRLAGGTCGGSDSAPAPGGQAGQPDERGRCDTR